MEKKNANDTINISSAICSVQHRKEAFEKYLKVSAHNCTACRQSTVCVFGQNIELSRQIAKKISIYCVDYLLL